MRRRRKRRLATTKVKSHDVVEFFSHALQPSTFKLSAFSKCRFYLNDDWWTSVIHYYQAQKCEKGCALYEEIRDAETPEEAKKIASSIFPSEEWLDNRYQIMKDATYAKFSQNKEYMGVLINTGEKPIKEISPYDTFWGSCNKGQNMMGKVLMEVRAELRKKLRLS